MKVFHTQALPMRLWKDGQALENGQPLQCWWPEAEAAYKAAGCPVGEIRVRNRTVVDGYEADTNDGLRSSKATFVGAVLEVGTV